MHVKRKTKASDYTTTRSTRAAAAALITVFRGVNGAKCNLKRR